MQLPLPAPWQAWPRLACGQLGVHVHVVSRRCQPLASWLTSHLCPPPPMTFLQVHSGADLQASASAASKYVPGGAKGYLGYVLSHSNGSEILPIMEVGASLRVGWGRAAEAGPARSSRRAVPWHGVAWRPCTGPCGRRTLGERAACGACTPASASTARPCPPCSAGRRGGPRGAAARAALLPRRSVP